MSGNSPERPPSAELLRFLSCFDSAIGDLALRLRGMVLEEAPTATELIYDAYNAVSVAFSFTGRMKEAFCHVAVYSQHVNLGLNRGAELPDPAGQLRGTGKLIRHLRVKGADEVEQPQIRHFIQLAVAHAGGPDPLAGGPHSRVQAVSARKRRPG